MDALFDYIVVDNPDAALRITDAIIETCELIAENPKIAPVSSGISVEGVRKQPIIGFYRYIIAYLAYEAHIEIIRVGYGGRDWDSLI